ncbi:MAG: AMP-binding protein, partial [Phycisphaerae bacterium]
GTRWADRIAIPLNYLLKPEELAVVLKDSGLRVVFTIEYFKSLGEQINAVLASQGAQTVQFIPMESLQFTPPSALVKLALGLWPGSLKYLVHRTPPRQPNDVAVILYTSGTSGIPKGVMLTNRNLESNAIDSVKHCRFTRKTVFLGILPMFHTLGLQANCLIPLMLGCKIVYQARFSPVGVFEAITKHKCEVLVAVPTLFAVLAAAKSAKPDSLKTLEYTISGGEPLPVSLIHNFKEKFGLTLIEGFGLTETSPIVAICVPWDHKIGSCGKVIPDVQVRLIADDGTDLGRNQDGELWIKGPNVMKGYYNQPQMTAEVLTPDGWFKTGDIARLDDEGFLYINGRKKDMIIMAGEKVFPREIEDALKLHPAVLHAAVIGIKDPARGEAPVAFVQLKAELPADQKPTANDLRSFVREKIAPYKTPRDVYFMDELPRSGTGKIMKRELKVPV